MLIYQHSNILISEAPCIGSSFTGNFIGFVSAFKAANLSHETLDCTALVTTTPAPLPDSGANTTVVVATATTTATVTITPAAVAPVSASDTTVTVTATSDLDAIATTATVGTSAITGVSASTAFSSDTVTLTSAGISAPSVITAGHGEEAVSQVENSLASLTSYPIQEQEVESRDAEDTTQAGTLPQEEAGNAYENLLGK